MKTLFGLIILALVGAHAMLWYEYGTAMPCEAAALRVVEDIGIEDHIVEAAAHKKELGDTFKNEFGLMGCYRVVLRGNHASAELITNRLKQYRE